AVGRERAANGKVEPWILALGRVAGCAAPDRGMAIVSRDQHLAGGSDIENVGFAGTREQWLRRGAPGSVNDIRLKLVRARCREEDPAAVSCPRQPFQRRIFFRQRRRLAGLIDDFDDAPVVDRNLVLEKRDARSIGRNAWVAEVAAHLVEDVANW